MSAIIIKQQDLIGLACIEWRFWQKSFLVFELDSCVYFSRPTKRNHFKRSCGWSRLYGRDNDMEKPVVPEAVQKEAREYVIQAIEITP